MLRFILRLQTLLALVPLFMSFIIVSSQAQTPWPFAGGNVLGTRAVNTPAVPGQLNVKTAPLLHKKWFFSTGATGAVFVTPTVEPGGLYFTATNGYAYKLDPDTGTLIWAFYGGKYLPPGSPQS